jgi:hypothetical protein
MVSEDPKSSDARLRRLARNIETLAEKDELVVRRAKEIAGLRRRAAAEIYSVCAGFVDSLNTLLSGPVVALDPPAFPHEAFREAGANLIQINVRGRILQVEFRATAELLSTEDFRIPYTLGGSIRAFNQALLEKDLIEEQLIFYTVERRQAMWRYFDARTYRSGEFDRDYLISLMDQLV